MIPRRPTIRRAFTLLEVMLAIGVFLLLVAGAFALVASSSQLIEEVTSLQDRESVRQRLVETLRVQFEELPADADLGFSSVESGGRYDTYLSFSRAPGAFRFGFEETMLIERVLLAAETRSDGFLRVGLYFLDDEDSRRAAQGDFDAISGPYVELIPRVRRFSWRFLDAETGEWMGTLEGGFPHSFLELELALPGDEEAQRLVFWHPEFS